MNTEELIKRFKEVHGERYDYSLVEYVTRKTKVKIICRLHGEFEQYSAHHANGSGCRHCAGNAKLTVESFKIKATKIHGDKYSYDRVVISGANNKVIITCKTHGDFSQAASMHLSGQGCPKCSGKLKLTNEIAIDRLKLSLGDNYTFDNFKYNGKKSKVIITCKTHGGFTTTYSMAEDGYGCPQCGGKKGKMTTDFFIHSAKLTHGDTYDYSESNFIDSYTPIKIKCEKHGMFEQLHHNHLKGTGCPHCKPKVSKLELQLAKDFSEHLPIKLQGVLVGKQELDIFFPQHSLAIEVNGVYYHHSGRKEDMYHLNKTENCLDIGVRLLHFWDFEIREKYEIVKSIVSAKLNLSTKIAARKTEVREIDSGDGRKFLEETHISGSGHASLYYGLFYEDELVAVASFCKPRYNQGYQWEVMRFASKLNTRVVGGFSKLLRKFIKDVNPTSIITYADRRFGEGEVYKKCGFEFTHNTKPNYFWVSKNGGLLKRYMTQKHRLQNLLGDEFDPKMSESANMQKAGYNKVYDSGNKVFIWRNKHLDK